MFIDRRYLLMLFTQNFKRSIPFCFSSIGRQYYLMEMVSRYTITWYVVIIL